MTELPHLSDRDRVLLVGLADGTLDERRRTEAEARVQELPGGVDLLERQLRVRRALRDGPAPVPPTTLLADADADAPSPGTTGRSRRAEPNGGAARRRPRLPHAARATRAGHPRRRWVPQAGLAGALAAALVALVLILQPAGPSVVEEAAALAVEPATAPAPASAGPVLDAGVEGVPFPDWSRDLGWHASGARRDRLDGRGTTTVFYEHMGHRIAYTILPGKPVKAPEGSRIVRRDGLEIALSRSGDRDIAVFERDGRTCVLAGHVERTSTLVELAAWTGGGAVRS